MSAYGGYVLFQNFLRSAIATGYTYHSTTDYGMEKITLDGLAAGAISGTVPFFTSTSNTDTWGFDVTTTDGKKYSGSLSTGFNEDKGGSTVILQPIIANSSTKNFNVYIQQAWGTAARSSISTSALEAIESKEG